MYFKTITLTADISSAMGWSKIGLRTLKRITQAKITEYCKLHKLKRKQIDYDIKYQAVITVKRKSIEHDDQIDLMDLVREAKKSEIWN